MTWSARQGASSGARFVGGVLGLLASGTSVGRAQAPARPAIVVRNHHALPYHGAVEVPVRVPDGAYAGPGGAGAEVRNGVARAVVDLAARGEVRLTRVMRVAAGAHEGRPYAAGPLRVTPNAAGPLRVTPNAAGPLRVTPNAAGPLRVTVRGAALALAWDGRALGTLDLALVVRSGTTATTEDAVREAAPLPLVWRTVEGGMLRAEASQDGFALAVTATPYGVGSLDVRTRLTRVAPAAGPAYVALVRRVTTPGAAGATLRFNGRRFEGARSPDLWDRDFWYVHGVDWLAWRAGGLRLVAVNGFTPVPTVQRKDSTFGEGSHFWVWERTRADGDRTSLVSEIAGPNAEQGKSVYMPVTPYAPVRTGDVVELRWRLAVTARADSGWEESQLLGFASHRAGSVMSPNDARRAPTRGAPTTATFPTATGTTAVIDLGVPAVKFGTSYFPYATFPENFDYARTPGLDREVWWAFSPAMWTRWREFAPRMRADLHIIRAMGFASVRLHHLELLRQMPRAEAFAFLDFYAGQARALGLRILVDTEGPEAWVREIVGRYRDVIDGVEVENEVLLYGIKPSDAARLAGEYRAAKAAAPNASVFLTSAGNNGVFERLRQLDVPFDRVGLHAYKHGPQWMESYGSHVLGTADYAATLGKAVTLGEFNWKSFGRLSDEARAPLVRQLYETVLAPRAIPELFEFPFAETQSVNTMLARDGTRHYEPLMLDRRPKPEAMELMRVIRTYAAEDASVRAMPVTVAETELSVRNGDGARGATARFTITNGSARAVSVRLSALSFDSSLRAMLRGDASVRLEPGATHEGTVTLTLRAGALPGTYHHFVRADYGTGVAVGWGIAANPGAPRFAAGPVLGDRVLYPQGAQVVDSLDWTRPLAVAFGDSASVLELESAYTLTNTLQAATGRRLWLSRVADLPDSLVARGTLVVVGSAARSARLGLTGGVDPAAGTAKTYATAAAPGVVTVQRTADGRRWLLVGGAERASVLAAATDLVLRFWPNAKDAAIRVTGTEPGAALGRRAGTVTNADVP